VARGDRGLGVITVAVAVIPLGVAYAGKGIVDAVVSGSARGHDPVVAIELAIFAIPVAAQRRSASSAELLGERLAIDVNNAISKAQTLELPPLRGRPLLRQPHQGPPRGELTARSPS